MKELSFVSMNDFQSWKEREEEATYATYVKSQQTYHPSSEGVFLQKSESMNSGMHNYILLCCRYFSSLLFCMLPKWHI